MKESSLKQKQDKNKVNAIHTITDAIRARKARKEMLNLSIERANKQVIEIAKEPAKRRRRRPAGSKNKAR